MYQGGTYMKRFIAACMCFVFLLVLVGCNSTNLKSGYYYLDGDFPEYMTPYVSLHLNGGSFCFGKGTLLSYAERGSFTIIGKKIVATTQNTVFVFEIKDQTSFVLTNCGGYDSFAEYVGLEFVYHNKA